MIENVKEQKYYAEVYVILKYLGSEYINKIPKKLIEVIEKTRDKNSDFKLDSSKALYAQNVCQETKDFIAGLNLLYWEKNEERKAKLLQHYKKNDIIYEEQLKEKYSYENLFKNNKNSAIIEEKDEKNEETMQLIEVKENIIQKIIAKIKEWFWRFKK